MNLVRMNIHLGCITSWKWCSTTKKIYLSYNTIYSQVLTSLAVKVSSLSHLLSKRGGIDGQLENSKTHLEYLSSDPKTLL